MTHPSTGSGTENAETLQEAARGFEEVFVEQLFRNMFSTLNRSSMVEKSFQRKIYEEMLQKEFADIYVENGGVGLGRALVEQLKSRMKPQQAPRPEVEEDYRKIERPRDGDGIEINGGTGWSRLDRGADSMKKLYQAEREAGDVSEKR
jgi:Rod binding domain-containing protein